MNAYLMMEDGTVYEGQARGAFHEVVCEVVFNTSMTGYLEVLTDPSYAGQGVTMTYPMQGNYGIALEDYESIHPFVKAFIVKELCDFPSNFRSTESLENTLIRHNIPCLCGVDTRSITKQLREAGTMRGILTQDLSDKEALMQKIKAYAFPDVVREVSVTQPETEGCGAKIALMDFGAKRNIRRSLVKRGCEVTTFPCFATAEEVLASKPDGLMLSNGPGNPEDCGAIIREIAKLYDSGIPTFAICLGHQLLALSQGGRTQRLKYGHRGANHPVKFLDRDRTFITSQNHGYMVMKDSLPDYAQVSHINVNDGTVEGVVYRNRPVFTVQFHPEASPGPRDTDFLFDDFLKMIREGR